VITCYPGNALLCELPSTDEGNEGDPFDLDDDEVVLWGNTCPKAIDGTMIPCLIDRNLVLHSHHMH